MSALEERADELPDTAMPSRLGFGGGAARSSSALESTADAATMRVMTISQAADLWLGELRAQGRAERTERSYRRLLDKLADAYPLIDVDEVTPTMCRRFLEQWKDRSPGTRNQVTTALNGLFGWLYLEGEIKSSPMARIQRSPMPDQDDNDNITTVTQADVDKLLEAAEGWPEILAINVAVYCGARRHALALIRITDYDPATRKLRFHEKGSKTIRKAIPHRLGDLIEAATAAGVYDEQTYLIPSPGTQHRIGDRDDRVIWRLIKRTADRAGVESHVHALRAAFAVQYLEAHPAEVYALKNLMGHKRIATTEVYLRRMNRDAAMETVRDLAWGANSVLPQIAGKRFAVSRAAEKEGFEPSFPETPDATSPDRQRADDAPLDEALKARIPRQSEVPK